MTRETENTVLLLVGISIAMITVSGAFTRYVKPGLLPWLVASAVLLIVLALAAMIGDIRRGGPRTSDQRSDDGDGHAHRAGMVWFLLVSDPAVDLRHAASAAALSRRPVCDRGIE